MNTRTPVLILSCKLGGLAIYRTLGGRGVECWGIDEDRRCPGFLSRYADAERSVVAAYDAAEPEVYLERVLQVAERIGRRALLIPTSDELVSFVARFRHRLERAFIFPRVEPELVQRLTSKLEMTDLARQHGVPVPETYLPADEADLLGELPRFRFPLMLKPCFGSGQNTDPRQQMVVVHDREQLLAEYRARETAGSPNMMLQEYIPGGDDQVYIFDGYLDADSNCLAGFTGRKIRQFPIHRGCAALGEQCAASEVVEQMTRFLGAIGYRGPVDIGLRLDPVDGRYKLLDVNPRVGQAFRLFVDEDGIDLVQRMYLDMTGQPVPQLPQREGRRWLIEDFDLYSTMDYRREGSLTLGSWLTSFRGLQETAWWSKRDPVPFLAMAQRLASHGFRYAAKGAKEACKRTLRRVIPLGLRKRAAVRLDRQRWIPSGKWWAVELVRDLAEKDPVAFHRFLWSHHLGYAETYESEMRFGNDKINRTRHMFFDDLQQYLADRQVSPEADIRSVFEVGCSLGYLLRHAETRVFPAADSIEGIDLDGYAVRAGTSYLHRMGSRVRLHHGDVAALSRLLRGRVYDVMFAAGVLMYVGEEEAQQVVREMLAHTGQVAAFAGLAHPDVDNAQMRTAAVRQRDGSFIHNIDAMVERSGGTVVYRRWEGSNVVDGNTVYFVFALPPQQRSASRSA